ncbi:uncharacterized protein EDB91DRAFT_1256267 [Suillus paluster]|uniref:uncharacterized protein n=1 Tax=Suillus paluster TaxID=48578 RepID=UPI001B885DA7|nr:uncharacterized protein EDB91DRAFT_1256267 [Suillus paluster]KAG1721979.1 hypothetical protein EDB91DRAFT_1256267 [Suillus paluster]
MASWTLVFSNVLNQHKDSFVAAKGNSAIRAHILKVIKDAIGSSEAAKDPCVMLPEKNLRKAVQEEIIEGGHKDRSAADAVTVEMVRERENDKPEEAGKYKTEFSGFDVAQKLFKDEFGEYDKMHRNTFDQKSMGQRTKLARAWHQAMSSEVKQELIQVAGKWNREGPPADTKDRYRTCNQKKVMEDFMGMVRRTMGLHLVILTAHDRGEGKAPGTTLRKKPFTQTSKDNKKWAGDAQDRLADWLLEAEYADEEDSDGEDSEDDDLPDLTVEVDDDGHPCLPKGFGSLKLKHRQKVVRTVFQKAYSLITNNPRAPVPWGEVSENPDHYLDSECIPKNVVIKDPSHLQKDTIAAIYSHWIDCASHGAPIPSKKGDEEDRLKKIDDGKSSSDEDEDNLDITPIADSSPKYHVTRDMVSYLKSLSIIPSYHQPSCCSSKASDSKAWKQQLPIWVSWTWSQAYLPKDIHENMETASAALENLLNYKFNSRGWGMIVVLGLGLLLRECRRAQEYEEDEATDDVPDYLGNSILGFQLGDQIVDKIAGIEAEVEAIWKDENLGLSVVRQDIEKRRGEERKKLEENRKAEEARVIEEKRVEDEKRAMEEKRVEEEARLAEEASKAEKRVRKSNAKGKGKRPAADVEEPSKKKVKSSPPDPPRHSGRDKVTSKKYNA